MVEVRESLARWLLKEGLINVGDVNVKSKNGVIQAEGIDVQKIGSKGRVQLSSEAVSKLQGGVGVLEVLLRVLPKEVATSYEGLKTSMKLMDSPIARLYNWNMLVPVLSSAGIELDVDQKALIVAGDIEAVLLVLGDLVGGQELINAVSSKSLFEPIMKSHEVIEPLLEAPVNIASPTPSVKLKAQTPTPLPPTPTVLSKGNVRDSLENVAVEALASALSLSGEEVSKTYISDGAMGLQRLLTNLSPTSGSREAIVALEALTRALCNMGPWNLPDANIRKSGGQEKRGLPTFLAAIAHGLGSSLEGVPSRSCNLLENAVKSCQSAYLLKPVLYDWIVSPLRAGPSLLLMLHLNRSKQQKISETQSVSSTSIESDIVNLELATNVRAITSLLVTIGDDGRMSSFLERDLRQLCSGPLWFMEALARMIPSFAQHPKAAVEIKESMSSVMTMALQMCESEDDKERKVAVEVLASLWASFPHTVEENVEVSLCRSVLAMLKRACRDTKESVRLSTYTGLLRLLESFVTVGSEHGTVVYKILIFTIIEHASDYNSRRQLLMGLGAILDRHEGMPVGVFIEPLVKQITRTQSHYTESNREKPSTSLSELDAEFLHYHIVRHSQLTTLHASLLLQLLANSGISFPETIGWVTQPLRVLAKRFCMEPSAGKAIEHVCQDFVSQMDRYISRQEMDACGVLSKFMQNLFPYVLSHTAQRMLKESFAKWNGILKSQNYSHSNEVMFEMMTKVLNDLPNNHLVEPSKKYKHPVDEVLNHRLHQSREETPNSNGGIRSLHTQLQRPSSRSASRNGSESTRYNNGLLPHRGQQSEASIPDSPVRSMSADSRGQRGAPSPSTAERLSKHRRKISYSELSDVSKKERQRKDAILRKERQREIDQIRLKREALKAQKLKEEEIKKKMREKREAARKKRNQNLLLHKPNVYGPSRSPNISVNNNESTSQEGVEPSSTIPDPHERDTIEDELILEALNRRLAKNPETVMPPGFIRKRVTLDSTSESVQSGKKVLRLESWTLEGVNAQAKELQQRIDSFFDDNERFEGAGVAGMTIKPIGKMQSKVSGDSQIEEDNAAVVESIIVGILSSVCGEEQVEQSEKRSERKCIVHIDPRLLKSKQELGVNAEMDLYRFLLKEASERNCILPFGFELTEQIPGLAEKYVAERQHISQEAAYVHGTPKLGVPSKSSAARSKVPQGSNNNYVTPVAPKSGPGSRHPSSGQRSIKSSRNFVTDASSLDGSSNSVDSDGSNPRRSLSAGAQRDRRSANFDSSEGGGGVTPVAKQRVIPFAEQAVRKYLRDYAETLIIALADKCDRKRQATNPTSSSATPRRSSSRDGVTDPNSRTPKRSSAQRTMSAELQRHGSKLQSAENSDAVMYSTPTSARSRAHYSSLHSPGGSSSSSSGSGSFGGRYYSSGGKRRQSSSARNGFGPTGIGIDFSYLKQRRDQEKIALASQRRREETKRIEQMKRDREHAEAIRLQVAAYREEKRKREDKELQEARQIEKMKKERARVAAEAERKRREEDKKKIKEYYIRVQAEQEEKKKRAEEELRLQEERRKEALKEYRRRKAREREKENDPRMNNLIRKKKTSISEGSDDNGKKTNANTNNNNNGNNMPNGRRAKAKPKENGGSNIPFSHSTPTGYANRKKSILVTESGSRSNDHSSQVDAPPLKSSNVDSGKVNSTSDKKKIDEVKPQSEDSDGKSPKVAVEDPIDKEDSKPVTKRDSGKSSTLVADKQIHVTESKSSPKDEALSSDEKPLNPAHPTLEVDSTDANAPGDSMSNNSPSLEVESSANHSINDPDRSPKSSIETEANQIISESEDAPLIEATGDENRPQESKSSEDVMNVPEENGDEMSVSKPIEDATPNAEQKQMASDVDGAKANDMAIVDTGEEGSFETKLDNNADNEGKRADPTSDAVDNSNEGTLKTELEEDSKISEERNQASESTTSEVANDAKDEEVDLSEPESPKEPVSDALVGNTLKQDEVEASESESQLEISQSDDTSDTPQQASEDASIPSET